MRARRFLAHLLLLAAWLLVSPSAGAFPGVSFARQAETPLHDTTHVVIMQHAGISVVTTMVDYRGQLQPFVLVLPVPGDVTRQRLETIKHEFVSRVEEVSAPRFHEFWEKDPCAPGAAAQSWDERVEVQGRGFLTPKLLPPRDAHYTVSNELSIPDKPIFKGAESEFEYQLLSARQAKQLESWLSRRGYRAERSRLDRLAPLIAQGTQLLLAEVVVEHAELVGSERLQLGGVRYWTKAPLAAIASTLGLANAGAQQDLFVYVLDRTSRSVVQNYANQPAVTNISIGAEYGPRIGVLYNALFDRMQRKFPRSFITEFVGHTDACGQPCVNAPLQLRELLTLGGDILEAQTVARSDRTPKPNPPAPEERAKLEAAWSNLSPGERRVAEREQQRLAEQLAARRALLRRQRYLLTRLHYRYTARELPNDVRLGSAKQQLRGGFGVPSGPAAALVTGAEPVNNGEFQVRFVAAHAWQGSMPCKQPLRWRWGKRWKSHSQHWRKVHSGRDLPRLGRDSALLEVALASDLPQLGLERHRRPAPPPSVASGAAAPSVAAAPEPRDEGCAFATIAQRRSVPAVLGLLAAAALAGRRRRRS